MTVVKGTAFVSNTAARNGGAAVFESDSDVAMHNCSFFDNTAFNGGSLYGDGQGARLEAVSTTVDSSSAFNEGGAVFVTGM